MAELSGTLDTYGVKGAREDLQNAIFMITPEDTPFISNIGRSRAKATKHEWQTDTLANPDTTNAQLEGDEYAYSTPAATVRVGNFTQISRKPVLVSRTLEAVDKAGRASELKYQSMKRGKELRKDMEAIVLSNQASVAGNGSEWWLQHWHGPCRCGDSWNQSGVHGSNAQDCSAGGLYRRRQSSHCDGPCGSESGLFRVHRHCANPQGYHRRSSGDDHRRC
jgi:hypothetical protein